MRDQPGSGNARLLAGDAWCTPAAAPHRNVRAQSLSPRTAGPLHRPVARRGAAARQEAGRYSGSQDAARTARLFDQVVAPLFDSAPVRLISKSPISLYALGIPPAQYDALVSSGNGNADLGAARARGAAGLRFSHPRQLFRLAGFRPRLRSGSARGGAGLSEGGELRGAEGARRFGRGASRLAAGFPQRASRPSRWIASCFWMPRTG